MKAKVRSYRILDDGTKEDLLHVREINIVFDEDLYFLYSSGVAQEIRGVFEYRQCYQVFSEDNLMVLESKINSILFKHKDDLLSYPYGYSEQVVKLFKDEYFDLY